MIGQRRSGYGQRAFRTLNAQPRTLGDPMQTKTRIVIAAAAIVAIGGGAGIATAASSGDSENPITGTELQQASQVALAHMGQGRVTGTEVGDEESYYQIEVTLDNGSQVDVQLDKDFHFVAAKADAENTGK